MTFLFVVSACITLNEELKCISKLSNELYRTEEECVAQLSNNLYYLLEGIDQIQGAKLYWMEAECKRIDNEEA